MTDFRVVIPARYGSSRLPGKPLLPIAGKPMIQHVHERAESCGACEIVVATDHEGIATAAEKFGACVCYTSTEHTSGTDRIAEVIEKMGWADDEIIVNLQGDEPLMPESLMVQVAQDLARHEDASTATLSAALNSASQVFDPSVVKVVTDQAGYALYFSRAPIPWSRDGLSWGGQPAEESWQHMQRHIGLYAYRAGFVREFINWPPAPLEMHESLEQLRTLWNGRRIHVSVANKLPVAGVDTAEDLARVEALILDSSL